MSDARSQNARRRALKALAAISGLPAYTLKLPLAHADSIVAVRMWPAEDYTRVTLESDAALSYRHFFVPDPPRLAVDLDGVPLGSALHELGTLLQPQDPYIMQVRLGQPEPGVARIVFDLRGKVAPQVFALEPVPPYAHRLVFDLYPAEPIDPLAQLIRRYGSEPRDAIAELARQAEARLGGAPASGDGPLAAVAPQPATPAPTTAPAPAVAAVQRREAPAGTTASFQRRPRSPVLVDRMVTVAIDPGHGGEDPGAVGRRGTLEKDVVLLIARKLRERIDREPLMRAYLTRDGDYFVPLGTRVAKARRVRADLFVSIHADAFVKPTARGASVFVLSDRGATSTMARWLAQRENRSDLIGGVNLGSRDREVAQVLLQLSTRAQIESSLTLGQAVLHELGSVGRLHKVSVEQAGFAVLKAPDIPSILVETAFISNPSEERKLRDTRYQARIADAILRGIQRYLKANPPRPDTRTV